MADLTIEIVAVQKKETKSAIALRNAEKKHDCKLFTRAHCQNILKFRTCDIRRVEKKKQVVAIKEGNNVFYKESEINAVLEEVNNYKSKTVVGGVDIASAEAAISKHFGEPTKLINRAGILAKGLDKVDWQRMERNEEIVALKIGGGIFYKATEFEENFESAKAYKVKRDSKPNVEKVSTEITEPAVEEEVKPVVAKVKPVSTKQAKKKAPAKITKVSAKK